MEEAPKPDEGTEEQKKADFTFKMPTKLLNATIGKSETQSSNMLSYKFTKDNFFNAADSSIDREGDEYLL